jgi:hypothetical protein
MPDLLAHALLAYSLATLCSWRFDWLTAPYVTVAMAGAFIPDITKIEIAVTSAQVETLLGLPFDWGALHTLGGSVVSLTVGVVLVSTAARRRVAVLLGVGAGSHLLADALLLTPSGRSYPLLWPLSDVHPPTPGLYLSTQFEPMFVAAALAAVVFVLTRRRVDRD